MLIKCPECQSDVSDKAPTCPKCGAPISSIAPATPIVQEIHNPRQDLFLTRNRGCFETVFWAAFIIFVIAMLFAAAGRAESFSAPVTRVIDGDTLVVDHNGKKETIRLQAIDAPEKKQIGGDASKQNMQRLANGKTAQIEPQKRPDKYGRTVAKVSVNGTDVGLAQIKAGQATHYKKYQGKQSAKDRREYSRAAKVAPKPKSKLTPEEFRRPTQH